MYELNVHSICMSIILFDIAIKFFWKTWKKSGKIMEFQNENLVATLIDDWLMRAVLKAAMPSEHP